MAGFLRFSLALLLSVVSGYPEYRNKIPNGLNVPHPCRDGETWFGVGHLNELGGGPRNPFGVDFYNNGKTWDATLCNMDSDRDGKTNGEELGDPDCVWTEGADPDITDQSALSHPGICDPFDAAPCTGKPEWVSCDTADLVCDALESTDVVEKIYRFPQSAVPAAKTTYMCMTFELPADQDYHFIGSRPFIDNLNVLHHMIIYGCTVDSAGDLKNALNTPYECGMSGDEKCRDVIDLWAVGVPGTCVHRNVGFPIGAKGYKYATMEMHWNNPNERNDYTDSSGMNMYFTNILREHEAAVLMIGQQSLQIPPGLFWYETSSNCSTCMKRVFDGPVYVTSAVNHMHYLGIRQQTELYRDGAKVMDLAYDKDYEFERPVTHTFDTPIMIERTDELKTTCVYQSRERIKTTPYGEGSLEEMCYAFLTVYPRRNLLQPECVSWESIELCELGGPLVQECPTEVLNNPLHPDNARVGELIMNNCDVTGICRKECKAAVKQAKQLYPCVRGDVQKYIRTYSLHSDDPSVQLPLYMFWTAFHSCDVELAQESCPVASGVFLQPAKILYTVAVLLLLAK